MDLAHVVSGQAVEVAHDARSLMGARSLATWSASSRSDGGGSPACTIHATIRSPRSGSGSPVIATSATPGCSSQRGLDLAGADLVAAALDQIRGLAPDQADVAVGLAGRRVAGPEPPVDECLVGRLGTIQVSEEQVRPADLDLADRLAVACARSSRHSRRRAGPRRPPVASRRCLLAGRRPRAPRRSSASPSFRSAR